MGERRHPRRDRLRLHSVAAQRSPPKTKKRSYPPRLARRAESRASRRPTCKSFGSGPNGPHWSPIRPGADCKEKVAKFEYGRSLRHPCGLLRGWGIQLSAHQRRLLEEYVGDLLEYNKTVNLTAETDGPAILLRHVADGLAAVPLLKENLKAKTPRLCDVGSGGGFYWHGRQDRVARSRSHSHGSARIASSSS